MSPAFLPGLPLPTTPGACLSRTLYHAQLPCGRVVTMLLGETQTGTQWQWRTLHGEPGVYGAGSWLNLRDWLKGGPPTAAVTGTIPAPAAV